MVKPHLVYSLRSPGNDVVGDGPPLHTVYEVTAWKNGLGGLEVWARGRMRRKDGEPGPSRSCHVDTERSQPEWLQELIADARRRLA